MATSINNGLAIATLASAGSWQSTWPPQGKTVRPCQLVGWLLWAQTRTFIKSKNITARQSGWRCDKADVMCVGVGRALLSWDIRQRGCTQVLIRGHWVSYVAIIKAHIRPCMRLWMLSNGCHASYIMEGAWEHTCRSWKDLLCTTAGTCTCMHTIITCMQARVLMQAWRASR